MLLSHSTISDATINNKPHNRVTPGLIQSTASPAISTTVSNISSPSSHSSITKGSSEGTCDNSSLNTSTPSTPTSSIPSTPGNISSSTKEQQFLEKENEANEPKTPISPLLAPYRTPQPKPNETSPGTTTFHSNSKENDTSTTTILNTTPSVLPRKRARWTEESPAQTTTDMPTTTDNIPPKQSDPSIPHHPMNYIMPEISGRKMHDKLLNKMINAKNTQYGSKATYRRLKIRKKREDGDNEDGEDEENNELENVRFVKLLNPRDGDLPYAPNCGFTTQLSMQDGIESNANLPKAPAHGTMSEDSLASITPQYENTKPSELPAEDYDYLRINENDAYCEADGPSIPSDQKITLDKLVTHQMDEKDFKLIESITKPHNDEYGTLFGNYNFMKAVRFRFKDGRSPMNNCKRWEDALSKALLSHFQKSEIVDSNDMFKILYKTCTKNDKINHLALGCGFVDQDKCNFASFDYQMSREGSQRDIAQRIPHKAWHSHDKQVKREVCFDSIQ